MEATFSPTPNTSRVVSFLDDIRGSYFESASLDSALTHDQTRFCGEFLQSYAKGFSYSRLHAPKEILLQFQQTLESYAKRISAGKDFSNHNIRMTAYDVHAAEISFALDQVLGVG